MTERDDKPTARGIDLQLNRLTRDEVAFMLFVVRTLRRGELVLAVGGDHAVLLERLDLKLTAHASGDAEPAKEGV